MSLDFIFLHYVLSFVIMPLINYDFFVFFGTLFPHFEGLQVEKKWTEKQVPLLFFLPSLHRFSQLWRLKCILLYIVLIYMFLSFFNDHFYWSEFMCHMYFLIWLPFLKNSPNFLFLKHQRFQIEKDKGKFINKNIQ